MSVALHVGFLDEMRRCDEEGFARYQKVFKDIARMLKKKKLPTYTEPEDLEGRGWWAQVIPSNGIAYLQRVAVYLWKKGTLPPPGSVNPEQPLADEGIGDVYENCYFYPDKPNKKGQLFPHMVCHSCRDGWWLPVDMAKVLVETSEYGSSIRLKKELEAIAAELELPLDLKRNSPEVQQARDHPGKGRKRWKKYGVESYNCLLLYEACVKSVELGAAIYFY